MKYLREFLPNRNDYTPFRKTLQSNIIAGITVGIVALPLALGFAITTGVNAAAGITTAILAGLVAAIFGGSHYQVSGPTGAMTVILVPVVASYGPAALAPLGILAGLVIAAMGLLRIGALIDRVPISVMEGFTLGIAMVIGLQQIPLAFGVKKEPGSHTLLVAWDTAYKAISTHIKWNSLAVVFGVLIIKNLWNRFNHIVKIPFHLPASIVAIVVATLVTTLAGIKVATIGSIPQGFQTSSHLFGAISNIPVIHVVYLVIVIALLGAIESLLSARVADGMAHLAIDHERPKHHPSRELFGQGLGTIVASIFGGIPATGAIARTSVNVRSGAKTRLASIVHALFLLLVALVLSPLVSHIPTAALAGVLLATSYRIANPTNIREQLRSTWGISFTFIATAIAVLAIDLIWGLAIGLAIHAILKKFGKL